MNTDLVIIPGGMTCQLQVLDVVVNKPVSYTHLDVYKRQASLFSQLCDYDKQLELT